MSARPAERKVQMPKLEEGRSPDVESLHETVTKLVEAHNQNDDELNRALRGGVSAANNSLAKYVTLEVQMPPLPPFINLTVIAPWTGTAAILMEPGGHVTLQGFIQDGGGGMGNAFTEDVLQEYMTPLRVALPGGLTLKVNLFQNNLVIEDPLATGGTDVYLAATWIAARSRAPHPFLAPWPLVVRHPFSRCLNLDVVAVFEETQGARSSHPLPVPDWADRGDGTLQLNALWGLCWNRKYKVRMRLSAEE